MANFIAKIQTVVALNGGGYYHKALYPPEERRIMERQESILTNKDDKIRRMERQLEERYQGEELEMEKRALWREEEHIARMEAERGMRLPFKLLTVFKIILVVAVSGLII